MHGKLRFVILLALSGLVAAGCTLGPDYIRPEAPVPLEFKEDTPWTEATPRDQLPKGAWWEVFGDPALNALEEQAAGANQNLRAAVTRLTQARAVARVSKFDLAPRLDLEPSARRSRVTFEEFGIAEGFTFNDFQFPIDLSYEVDLWGRVRRSVEAATAEAQASAADLEAVRLTLHAEVARNYFALRSLDGEIALLQRTVALRRENLALVTSLFENGQIGRLDVARAEAELATTEADAVGLQRQRAELEHALAVLVGRPPAQFELAPSPLEALPPAVAPGLPAQLLERRPDIAVAERGMAAANARIGVAKTAFFPAISLTGSAGYASGELSSLFDWDNRTWGLGPFVSLPIFDAGRNRAELKRSKATYEEAVARYRQQVLTAFREVEDALSGLRVLSEQADLQRRAVQAAGEAADISDLRYRSGYVSYLEVVDAQRTALQTERVATQIQGLRFQATLSLIKAIGGGWLEG